MGKFEKWIPNTDHTHTNIQQASENMPKPAHPIMLLPDLAIASTFWSLTVPPLKLLRVLPFLRPRLAKADLTGKVAVVTGANRGCKGC